MSVEIEKRKRKDGLYQADQTTADSILTFLGIKPLAFEFVVDLSLDECKDRLESQRIERGFWAWFIGRREIDVDVWTLGADTYEFKVLKKQPKHLDVVLDGTLTRISSYTSLVAGQIKSPLSYFAFIYTLAVLIFITVVWASLSAQLAPLPALWFALLWPVSAWFNKRDRDLVLERFERAMTAGEFAKPKRKRSSIA